MHAPCPSSRKDHWPAGVVAAAQAAGEPLGLGQGQEGAWAPRVLALPWAHFLFLSSCPAWELRFCFCFQRLGPPREVFPHVVLFLQEGPSTCFALLPLPTWSLALAPTEPLHWDCPSPVCGIATPVEPQWARAGLALSLRGPASLPAMLFAHHVPAPVQACGAWLASLCFSGSVPLGKTIHLCWCPPSPSQDAMSCGHDRDGLWPAMPPHTLHVLLPSHFSSCPSPPSSTVRLRDALTT